MIGDSWSMFHNNLNRDSVLRAMLQKRINVPVKVRSRGKGGANSKEIYYYMFSSRTIESEHEPDRCTQPLLEEHPDYCLISAGINDACQGKGTDFYCKNYLKILRLLLHNHIRPVVLELPTVVGGGRFKVYVNDLLTDRRGYIIHKVKIRIGYKLASWYNHVQLDDVTEYRERLKNELESRGLMDSVVYISNAAWNPDGYLDKRDIYTEDGTHLNLNGYDILDSCYADMISKDYKKHIK